MAAQWARAGCTRVAGPLASALGTPAAAPRSSTGNGLLCGEWRLDQVFGVRRLPCTMVWISDFIRTYVDQQARSGKHIHAARAAFGGVAIGPLTEHKDRQFRKGTQAWFAGGVCQNCPAERPGGCPASTARHGTPTRAAAPGLGGAVSNSFSDRFPVFEYEPPSKVRDTLQRQTTMCSNSAAGSQAKTSDFNVLFLPVWIVLHIFRPARPATVAPLRAPGRSGSAAVFGYGPGRRTFQATVAPCWVLCVALEGLEAGLQEEAAPGRDRTLPGEYTTSRWQPRPDATGERPSHMAMSDIEHAALSADHGSGLLDVNHMTITCAQIDFINRGAITKADVLLTESKLKLIPQPSGLAHDAMIQGSDIDETKKLMDVRVTHLIRNVTVYINNMPELQERECINIVTTRLVIFWPGNDTIPVFKVLYIDSTIYSDHEGIQMSDIVVRFYARELAREFIAIGSGLDVHDNYFDVTGRIPHCHEDEIVDAQKLTWQRMQLSVSLCRENAVKPMYTERTWHRVPVFENDRRCLLSREPHRSRKTGQNAYGWILGQDGRPLYAVQSARIAPPASGWRKFQGTPPAPEVQAFAGPAEAEAAAAAAACAAKGLKERGNALFGARDFEGAEACWTRAIDLGDRLQDEELCVALLANRAQVRLRRKKWREARSQNRRQTRPRLLGKLVPTPWRHPVTGRVSALLVAAVAPSVEGDAVRAALLALVSGAGSEVDAGHKAKRCGSCQRRRGYADAADFAERCLKAHPGHPDAESLLAGVRKMEAEEAPRRPQGKAPAQEAGTGRDQPAGASIEQPDLGPRSTTPEEKPPLHELPYHKMGLPKEQVEMMDKFFGDMRMQKETAARAKSAEEGAQPQ
ncbi:unnamed protein product, partial [Prorocentrum cordatum]